jgi:hypothetical protein
MIYQLVVENEPQAKIVEIAGDYVAINPGDWGSKRDVTVEMHLGYGEQEQEAQKYLALHTMMGQDPNLVYNVHAREPVQAHDTCHGAEWHQECQRLPDTTTELPEKARPSTTNGNADATEANGIQERQTQVAEMKAQMDAQIAQMKLQLEQLKAQNQFAIQSDSMDLKEAQLEHKQFVDNEELRLREPQTTSALSLHRLGRPRVVPGPTSEDY